MPIHKYIGHYPRHLIEQVETLVNKKQLGQFLQKRYPNAHSIHNDAALRDYIHGLKQQFMRQSAPLSKVVYDNKIHVLNNALGLHSYVSRVQGGRLKSKNEIRISSLFKRAPEEFLAMIAVHELAHLKEKEHNKAFYRLCQNMLADYHQIEFDTRLFLLQTELEDA
jgi:predicted metal-dependent hydrolase